MEQLSDFDFYLKFTRPLILNLPENNDRILAAAWVQKLAKDTTGSEKVRLDHLKLLLFVLQRKKLAPPFTQHPNALESLEDFPQNLTLVDVAKNIVEKENEDKREKFLKRLSGEGDFPPYISDFSADLLEYVAVQTIDDFGVHAYYAVSKFPLNSWYRTDKQLFPKAAKSMIEVSTPPPAFAESQSSPELVELSPEKSIPPPLAEPPVEPPPPEEPPPETEPVPEPEPEPPKEETPKKKEPRKSTLGASPPSRPIGKLFPPLDEWEPPTWGSNLLEAKLLDEGIEDIVKQIENIDDFFADSSRESDGFPTEVLWSSPPRYNLDDYNLDDESPVRLVDDDVPSFDEMYDPELFRKVPSPPQFTPISPGRRRARPPTLQPRRGGRKPPPKVKQTRSSQLQQKKKEAELEPPPPPRKVVKKPPPQIKQTRSSQLRQKKEELAPPPPPKKVVKKPPPQVKQTRSSQALQEKKEAELEPPPPPRKVVKKPPLQIKQTRSSQLRQQKKEAELAPPSKRPSKGKVAKKPSKGKLPPAPALDDEVQEYLTEFNTLLGEIEEQHQIDSAGLQPGEEAPPPEEVRVVEKAKPKRQLSRLAKMLKPKISKSHGAAVELDKSIHVSSEAREIFEAIIEGPSTSSGIAKLRPSRLRAPKPLLKQRPKKEEQVQRIDDQQQQQEEESSAAEDLAQMEAPHGHVGKDPRLVTTMNEMIQRANEEYDLDDFEAAERQVEEEMRRAGEDPHARRELQMSQRQYEEMEQEFEQAERYARAQLDELEQVDDDSYGTDYFLKLAENANLSSLEPDFDEYLFDDVMDEEPEYGEQIFERSASPRASASPQSREKYKKSEFKSETDEEGRTVTTSITEEVRPEDGFEFHSEERIETSPSGHMVSTEERVSSPRRSASPRPPPSPRGRSPRSLEATILEVVPADSPPRAEERYATSEQLDEGLEDSDWGSLPPMTEEDMLEWEERQYAEEAPEGTPSREQEASPVDVEDQTWTPGPEFFQGLPRRPLSPRAVEDENFMPGSVFFQNQDERTRLRREESFEFMFPGINLDELKEAALDYADDIPEEFFELEEDFDMTSPAQMKQELDDIALLYKEYYESLPAYAGVPVTTPRRTATPQRSPEARGGPVAELMEIAELSPEGQLKKMMKKYRRRPPWLPESPPISEEEERPLPNLEDVEAMYSPEHFQHKMESPGIQYEELKPTINIDLAELSPPRRAWFEELEQIHGWLSGTQAGRQPEVFDLPGERMHAESPPRLRSPVSPVVSPPRDLRFLQEGKYVLNLPKHRDVVGGALIQRRKKRTVPDLLGYIEESTEEPPPHLTPYDIELKEKLGKIKRLKQMRRICFPKRSMRVVVRNSPAPSVGRVQEVYESPTRTQPDIFDLPPLDESMYQEAPPEELFPGVPMTAEDYERRMRVVTAGEFPEKSFDQIARQPELSAIGSPVDYPELSPATSRPAPPSPAGRQGPLRRSVRKKLRKKAIDFSKEPTSPDELLLELIDVETELRDDEERDLTTPPPPEYLQHIQVFSPHYLRQLLDLTPDRTSPVQEGSPRTPVARPLEAETLIDVGQLAEFSPTSPLSAWGVIDEHMADVKERGVVTKRKKKEKKLKSPALGPLIEERLTERVGEIDYEVRQEVEAAWRAEAERDRPRRSILDEDVPVDLPPPLQPPVVVPGYVTPPHLRRKPISPPKRPLRVMPRAIRDVLAQEEEPEFYAELPGDTPSPRTPPWRIPILDDIFWDAVGKEGTVLDVEAAPDLESPTGPGTPPRIVVVPPTADRIQQIADDQYASLLDTPPRRVPPIPESIQQIADAQYASLLDEPPRRVSPSPRRVSPPPQRAPPPRRRNPAVEDLVRKLEALSAYHNAPPPSFPELEYKSQIPDSMAERMLEERLRRAFEIAVAAEARARAPEVVEFEYQETVKEHKPPKAVKPASKVIKALKGKGKGPPPKKPEPKKPPVRKPIERRPLAKKPSDKKLVVKKSSEKTVVSKKGSDKTLVVKKSSEKTVVKKPPVTKDTRPSFRPGGQAPVKFPGERGTRGVKVTKSEQSVVKLKSVKSKIDTGRTPRRKPEPAKKKPEPKKPPEPEPPPPLEFDYDIQALQELAINAADLYGMNLLDVAAEEMPELVPAGSPRRPVDPDWPQQWVPPSKGAERLPALTETEEEHRPQIMGQDMMWHLSPQTRVNLRCPEIKILPEAFTQESRFKFEEVHLESPPREAYDQLLPVATGEELGIRGLEYEELPEFVEDDDVLNLMDEDYITSRAEQRWQEMQQREEGLQLDEEGRPLGLLMPSVGPDFVKTPSPQRPSPRAAGLKGDLYAQEFYDPQTQTMTKKVFLGGKFQKVTPDAKTPGKLDLVTPPRELIAESPDSVYGDDLFEGTPSPFRRAATPSPRRLDTTPSPFRKARTPSPRRPSPDISTPSPFRRARTPSPRRPSPLVSTPSPFRKPGTPSPRRLSPLVPTPSPFLRAQTPTSPIPSPYRRAATPPLFDFGIDESMGLGEEMAPIDLSFSPPPPDTPPELYVEHLKRVDIGEEPEPEVFFTPPTPMRIKIDRDVDIATERAPRYFSPVSPLEAVEEHIDVFEGEEFAPEVSPPLYQSPVEMPPDPEFRKMYPSPPKARRLAKQDYDALYFEPHGLPQVERAQIPPTPQRLKVPKGQRRLPRRRIDFGEARPVSPPAVIPLPPPPLPRRSPERPPLFPPTPPAAANVSILTVELERPTSPPGATRRSLPFSFAAHVPTGARRSLPRSFKPATPPAPCRPPPSAGRFQQVTPDMISGTSPGLLDAVSPVGAPREVEALSPVLLNDVDARVLDVVSPVSPLLESERLALMQVESPGFEWGGRSPSGPEDQANFEWPSPRIFDFPGYKE